MSQDPAQNAPQVPFQPVAAPDPAPPAPPPPGPAVAPAIAPSGSVTPPEPGYTTTEFWVTVGLVVVGLLVSFGVIHVSSGQLQSITGLVVTVAPSLAYILGRSIRKRGLGS